MTYTTKQFQEAAKHLRLSFERTRDTYRKIPLITEEVKRLSDDELMAADLEEWDRLMEEAAAKSEERIKYERAMDKQGEFKNE